jgi:Na+-driven multidrug efflux pump
VKGTRRLTISRRHLRVQPEVLATLFRASIGGTGQFLIATASWVALTRIIAQFGEAALAGYTIALRIFLFAMLPAWGMSNAAATLVGQNLGAAKPERAEKAVWRTGFYNLVFLGSVALVFIIGAKPIVALFTGDPLVAAYGEDCLRCVAFGYVFYAYGMVMVQAFNGAGDTFTPSVLNLFCYWLWQVPLAYGLAHGLALGPRGVFIAIAISESTLAVVGMIAFRRGRWKTRTI